jgi:AraC-like DNA-binding protein
MPPVAALLDSRAALLALRRALHPGPPALATSRSVPGLRRLLHARRLDAVVLGLRRLEDLDLVDLRAQYPGVPVIVFGAFRPDHGDLMVRLVDRLGVAEVAVEGVDEACLGEMVRRHMLARARDEALADAPRLLRLTEPLQLKAWAWLIARAGEPVRTTDLAGDLGVSREHLSRQFAAGGAPNLKRVIDLFRVMYASQLAGNPAHPPRILAPLLDFATASHLDATCRRITGAGCRDLPRLGPRGVLLAFRRVGMRSRV